MSSPETVVGRVRIHVGEPDSDGDSYRGRGDGVLVITRTGQPLPNRPPIAVTGVIAMLNLAVACFAAYVRSWPAMGAASLAILAGLWLVFGISRKPTITSERIQVDDRLRAPELDVPAQDVEAVGVGLGGSSSRTVWVRVNRGRSLVLDDLTDAEAEATAEALREAIERRRADSTGPARV